MTTDHDTDLLAVSEFAHDDESVGVTSPMDRFLSASSLLDDDDPVESGTARFQSGFSDAAETFEEPTADLLSADCGSGADHDEADSAPEGLVGDYVSATTTDAAPESTLSEEAEAQYTPVSSAEVLARLGQSGVWSDDDEASDSDARFENTSSPPVNSIQKSQASGGKEQDEDESIEDYMARLLNRSRGGDQETSVTPTEEPTKPITEYNEVNESPRQAPEAACKLDAMRELANETRRTAIASHAKRNWSSVMKLKLTVSIFAAVAVSASIIFFWGDPITMICGIAAGLAVLAYWGCLAHTYRKLVIDSLMLDASSHTTDDSDDVQLKD
jgi:hypothetical protein